MARSLLASGRITGPLSTHDQRKRLVAELDEAVESARWTRRDAERRIERAWRAIEEHDRKHGRVRNG